MLGVYGVLMYILMGWSVYNLYFNSANEEEVAFVDVCEPYTRDILTIFSPANWFLAKDEGNEVCRELIAI